jgi:hypothetical protein
MSSARYLPSLTEGSLRVTAMLSATLLALERATIEKGKT